ncbi:MAG: thermonuclease family protein, partial [Rectinemataceae bacterium]|nr:thermonuclease family protein [Rectinemataceae bacterium]
DLNLPEWRCGRFLGQFMMPVEGPTTTGEDRHAPAPESPMKKFRALPLVLILFLSIIPAWSQDPTVYITASGAKYHALGCAYLKKSSIPIPLSEAIAHHFEPCSVCHPPKPDPQPEPPKLTANSDLYRVDLAEVATSSTADLSRMLPAHVSKHVDGDTVHVTIANPPPGIRPEETIRLLGVDTPETVDPRKPVQVFGKEASDFTKIRLLGKEVLLAFDWDLRDNYGRLLAYIYLPDGTCFNATLLQEGFGRAYLQYPFHFLEEFRSLDRTARESRKGLWGL